MTEDDVDTLATACIGAPPGQRLRRQLQRGHGNPFYVLELVQALAGADDLAIVGGEAEVTGHGLPPNLRSVLLRRLSYLPVETLEILTVAAVLGSGFDVAQLALVTRRPVMELMGVLDEALRAGILAESGTRLTFRHDLIREALYTDLALPIRTGLHLDVARALAEAGAPAIQVAEHFALGARPGDTNAVSWLHEAARGEQSRAPAVAAELLTRAREIAGPHHPAADALSADLVLALSWSGRLAEAEAEALEVLAHSPDPAVESVVRFGLITALFAQGKIPEAQRQAQAALAHSTLAGWARARLNAQAAFGPIFMGDLLGGMAAADAALAQAEESGDELAACIALCALCAVALVEGRLHEGVAHALAAVERAEHSPTRSASTWHSNVFLGWALDACERPAEAEEALRRGRRLAEELGWGYQLPVYQWVLVWGRFVTGQWDDAIAEAQAGLVLADEVGARIGVVAVHAMLAMIALHRNDLRQARRAVEIGEAELARSGPQPLVEWVASSRAAVEEAGGDTDAALAALSGAWDACTGRGVVAEHPRLGPDLVRLLVATGQREHAGAVVAQVEDVAPRMDTRSARAAALRCRGLLDADHDLLCEAVCVLRGSPRPLERATACEEAAGALRDVAETMKSTELLEEALGIYEELGAIRDIARVEAALRSLGRRPSRRGWRQRQAKAGWDALTRTELEVVTLAGEGLTNREVAERLYISPRTVETHMTHVFAKLGLSSRVDLRAEVARRRTDDQGHSAPPTAPGAGRASR
ncbi:MAG TPA: LuxR C-terminal-related transcriptional regulator [Acidimicrobiales bacterium]|nr:LuxR C-terminal-related transcriptional regulator [Acidimicrobiales bacterium]